MTLFLTLAAIAGVMVLVWLLSLALRDASIIDPFWGLGFVVVSVVAYFWNDPATSRTTLLVTLTSVWGIRLSAYLLWRNAGHGEDRRYQAMRAKHGPRFWWISLFTVFLLQALILWFVSWPIQVACAAGVRSPLGVLDLFAGLLWLIGFSFETVGDWQLARFKATPANTGRVMDRGLWRFTRHPNYFGDCCVWWGLYLLAAGGGAWWTVLSPLAMTLLLLKISGVSLLEKTIADRRPDYIDYQARTNAFFPGPPRERVSGRAACEASPRQGHNT
jgi:steroid 5-alpha reductase family enzyme